MTRVLQTPLQPPPANRLTWLPGSILAHESLIHVLRRVAWLNGASAPLLIKDFGRGLPPPFSLDHGNQVLRLAALAKAMGEPRSALRTCDLAQIPQDSWRFFHPILRYCPHCSELGYHSRLFSLKLFSSCPWHGDRLISCNCESPQAHFLSGLDTLFRGQCKCGVLLCQHSRAHQPGLDPSEPHALDDVVAWLKKRSGTSFEGPMISRMAWPTETLRQHAKYCAEAIGIRLPELLQPSPSNTGDNPCIRVFRGPTIRPVEKHPVEDGLRHQGELDREARAILSAIGRRLRHQVVPRRPLYRHLCVLISRSHDPHQISQYIGSDAERRYAWAFLQWMKDWGQDHLILLEVSRGSGAASRMPRDIARTASDDGLRGELLPYAASKWIKRHLVAERAMLTWVAAQSRPVPTFATENEDAALCPHPVELDVMWSMASGSANAARLHVELPRARSAVFRSLRSVKTIRPGLTDDPRRWEIEDLFRRPALHHSDVGWTVVYNTKLQDELTGRWIRKHRLLHVPANTTYVVIPAGTGYLARTRRPMIEAFGSSPGEATEALRQAVRKFEKVAAYLPSLREASTQ